MRRIYRRCAGGTGRAFRILLVIAVMGAFAEPGQAQSMAGVAERIEDVLAGSGVPGLAVVVVSRDSVLLADGYGVLRVGGTEPVDARTLFQVGSLTKGVTAAAVGVLVDGGVVDWDDPIRMHVTGFALADPWVTERFTIRDALAMRDGIPGGDSIALFTERTRQEILARAGTLHPSRFRATYGDSPNLDYFLAGEVVTAAAGESWDEFVEERIFRPLGMDATSSVLSEATADPNMATGHVGSAGRFEVTPYRNVENVAAAAGMITNVSDLARWLRLHLGRGSVEGRQILSQEVLAESYRPQNILTPAYQALFNPEGLLNAYGFGWVVSEYRGVTLIEHGGALPGFGAVIAMIPERDVGVALLSNASLNQSIGMLKQLKFELLDLFIRRIGSP